MKRFGTALMYAYVAIAAYTMLVGAIFLGLKEVGTPDTQPVAQTQPVVLKPMKLSKSQRAVDQLAALTPGCEVHDWGCVVGKAGAK